MTSKSRKSPRINWCLPFRKKLVSGGVVEGLASKNDKERDDAAF